jgi:hypothetical protein
MAGLLRRSLATTAPAQGECPGTDLLAAYYERSLGSDEMSHCEAHISRCSRCREELAMMARTEPDPKGVTSYVWLWNWRFVTSAAAALLILTIWGVRRSALIPAGSQPPDEPLVAMSRPDSQPGARAESGTEQNSPPQSPQFPALSRAPQSGVARNSRSQGEIEKFSPRLQATQPAEPNITQERSPQDLPAVGSDTDQLKIRQEAQVADQDSVLAKRKALDEKSASASEPALSASGTMGGAAAVPSSSAKTEGGVTAGNLASRADVVTRARPPETKQTPAVSAAGGFGAANDVMLTQPAEQRSAQTIIRTPDPKVLWRIAGGGFVERTENGGSTWHGQLPESNAHLTAGVAPTTRVLWVVGENGLILLTKDATHWKKIPPPIPANFVSVEAKTSSSAIVTSADGRRFSTSDRGKKWVPAP